MYDFIYYFDLMQWQ